MGCLLLISPGSKIQVLEVQCQSVECPLHTFIWMWFYWIAFYFFPVHQVNIYILSYRSLVIFLGWHSPTFSTSLKLLMKIGVAWTLDRLSCNATWQLRGEPLRTILVFHWRDNIQPRLWPCLLVASKLADLITKN